MCFDVSPESSDLELDRPERGAAELQQWMVRKAHREILSERFPAEEQEEPQE